jgi:hypothetical protein
MRASHTACLMVGALSLGAAAAVADVTIGSMGFDVIPATASALGGSSTTQYSVTLIDLGPAFNPNTGQNDGRVSFRFMNTGSVASSICDVYFQDGTLLSLIGASAATNTQVHFSSPANPGDLPGGQDVTFSTTSQWSADSDPPVEHNGVNNYTGVGTAEYVDITFWLQNGMAAADTWAAMHLPFPWAGPQHGLRMGIHVQGFDDGSSASFLSEVPLPQSSMLAVFGAGGLAIRRRRR